MILLALLLLLVSVTPSLAGNEAFLVRPDESLATLVARSKDPLRESSWYNLDEPNAYLGAIVSPKPNHLTMFSILGDGDPWYVKYKNYDGKTWGRWKNLGEGAGFPPRALALGEGRMIVFAVFVDYSLRYRYFDGTTWSAWSVLKSEVGAPPVLAGAEVTYQSAAFTALSRAGGSNFKPGTVVLVPNAESCVPIDSAGKQIALDAKLRDLSKFSEQAKDTGVSVAAKLPKEALTRHSTLTAKEAIGPTKSPLVHLFVEDKNGKLWHRAGSGQPGRWGAWRELGPTARTLTALITRGDQVDVVGSTGNLSDLQHAMLTSVGGEWKWSGWKPLGKGLFAPFLPPVIASLKADQLDVFATSADKTLYHRRRTGAQWSNWQVADTLAVPLMAVPTTADYLQVLTKKADHNLYLLEYDGSKFGRGRVGGYVRQLFGGAFSSDKCRFDFLTLDFDLMSWHKFWARSIDQPKDTGLKQKAYKVGGEGQLCDLFYSCNAGLVCDREFCEKPPPTPVPAPRPTAKPTAAPATGGGGGGGTINVEQKNVCSFEPIPPGWFKTDSNYSLACGSVYSQNVNFLTRVTNAPKNYSLAVCLDSPTVDGWRESSRTWIGNRCGAGATSSGDNMRYMQKE